MPALAELQRTMAHALLSLDAAGRAAPEPFFVGADAARDGLHVHRNTVIGGCWNALRLSYPALERWLGATAFAALAADFARLHPPTEPALSRYGAGFGAFVAARLDDDAQSFARALADFDWRFERVAQCPPDDGSNGTVVPLDESASLRLVPGLQVQAADWPVDSWRERLLALPEALGPAHLDQPPTRCDRALHWALWRSPQGVHVRPLGAAAAALLTALLAGDDLSGALALASAAQTAATDADEPGAESAADPELIATLEREVLSAPFARLAATTPLPGDHPA